jgi:hypothetical protein
MSTSRTAGCEQDEKGPQTGRKGAYKSHVKDFIGLGLDCAKETMEENGMKDCFQTVLGGVFVDDLWEISCKIERFERN